MTTPRCWDFEHERDQGAVQAIMSLRQEIPCTAAALFTMRGTLHSGGGIHVSVSQAKRSARQAVFRAGQNLKTILE